MRATTVRQIVSVCTIVVLLTALIPPAPALATGTDIAHTPPSGVTVSVTFIGDYDQSPPSPCVNSAAVVDADDDTCWARGNDDLYTDSRNGMYVQFANGSGTAVDMLSFRIKWSVCQYGFSWNHGGCSTNGDYGAAPDITHWYIYCDDGSGNPVDGDPILYDSGTVALAGGTIGAHDSGQINFADTCTAEVSGTRRITLKYSTDSAGDGHPAWGNGQALVVSSFEVFTVSSTLPASFEDYIANLRISHPAFSRLIQWDWIKTWTGGCWELTDEDDDVLAGTSCPAGGETAGTSESVSISCPIVCGPDTYTITIAEIGYETVSYEISSDSDGVLIPPVAGIRLGGLSVCYNADYEQCGSGQAATTVHVTYSILPGGQADNVVVNYGSQYLYGPGFDGDPWYTDTVDGGAHTQTTTVTSPYPVGGQLFLITACGPLNCVQATKSVDWVDGGDGGGGVVFPPPPPPPGGGGDEEQCGSIDVACAVRWLLRESGNMLLALFVPCLNEDPDADPDDCITVPELVGVVFNELGDKVPFAWVLGGATVIGGVFQLAVDGVAAWDNDDNGAGEWCYSNTLTLWHGVGDTSDSTLALCLDTTWLEDGYPGYREGVRPVMDWAVYIGALFAIVKRLSPKPVVVG